MNTSHPF